MDHSVGRPSLPLHAAFGDLVQAAVRSAASFPAGFRPAVLAASLSALRPITMVIQIVLTPMTVWRGTEAYLRDVRLLHQLNLYPLLFLSARVPRPAELESLDVSSPTR